MNIRTSDEKEQGESLLPQSEREDSEASESPRRRQSSRKWQWISMACAVTASLALGYISGVITESARDNNGTQYGLPSPPGSVQQIWQHNLTFTERPSLESEAAWASIIPVGRGFVHHDQLAPFISNIAVFHQLHCLHAIVIAYYTALESPPVNLTDVPAFENTTATRILPMHIRHCFDYIRRALMCAADTNLEVLNRTTHITNGWGQPKTCRDYNQVVAWAELYANSSDTGIVT